MAQALLPTSLVARTLTWTPDALVIPPKTAERAPEANVCVVVPTFAWYAVTGLPLAAAVDHATVSFLLAQTAEVMTGAVGTVAGVAAGEVTVGDQPLGPVLRSVQV